MSAEKKRRRGDRGEKSRKRGKFQHEPGFDTQPHPIETDVQDKHGDFVVNGEAGADYIGFGLESDGHHTGWQDDTPFYGLLDAQEQEYYTSVNAKLLALDEFPSDEATALFIDAVYRESDGKELKIASSQSCSRYLERLIQVSSRAQVRALFAKFVGHFLQLVQHRFASHCCEALFLRAAKEIGKDDDEDDEWQGEDGQETKAPAIDQLFLTVVDELEPNLGYLLTERFASHVLRVLLLVLSGEPLSDVAAGSALASRKKEKIEPFEFVEKADPARSRHVPRSFKDALRRIISGSISGLDTTYMQALATHPTGNPTLQILLRLEMLQGGKSKAKDSDSVLHRLLPDSSLAEDTDSARFAQGILYDPTGSRLLETIIQRAPGKMFKKLYGNILKQRMGSMAKNEIAGYVAVRILERLSAADLKAARDEILPEVPTLVARNRLGIIRVLLERCDCRGVDMQPVVAALQAAYGSDPSTFLLKMLQLDSKDEPNNVHPQPDTKQPNPHGSLLACTLTKLPTTCPLIHQALQSLPTPTLVLLAKNPSTSRLLQQSLQPNTTTTTTTTKSKPNTKTSTSNRYQYLPRTLLPHTADLATDPSGSHLIDAFWSASAGISFFVKERMAEELAGNEGRICDSSYGRSVWRNWKMQLYVQQRRREWKDLARGVGTDEVGGTGAGAGAGVERKKTALELARLRFVSTRQGEGLTKAGLS